MKNKKVIIFTAILLLIIIFVFIMCIYIIKNNSTVEKEKRILIENYISKQYNIDCKIIQSSFSHYDKGITGGLYMYDFKCIQKNGKIISISYTSYIDLSEDTLSNLKIEK